MIARDTRRITGVVLIPTGDWAYAHWRNNLDTVGCRFIVHIADLSAWGAHRRAIGW